MKKKSTPKPKKQEPVIRYSTYALLTESEVIELKGILAVNRTKAHEASAAGLRQYIKENRRK